MKRMSKVIVLGAVIICAAIGVSAQTANGQKHTFEGAQVTNPTRGPVARDGGRYVITVSRKPGVVQLGPRTTYLKEGLTTEEVLRVMGRPTTAGSERNEQGSIVTSYEFSRGDGRVLIAEFIDNALVRSRTETHEEEGTIEGLSN